MIIAVLSYPETFSEFSDLTLEKQNILQICCTWGDNLADGVLTFHINHNNSNHSSNNSDNNNDNNDQHDDLVKISFTTATTAATTAIIIMTIMINTMIW